MKKIVLFGDSLFNGFRNHQNTPVITNGLKKALDKGYEVLNYSQSGATTVEGLDFLVKIPTDSSLVLVEYGTNDASVIGIDSERFEINLSKMIQKIGPQKVIVVSPWQEYGPNEYLIAENLQQNYQIAQNLAQAFNCPFIDLWSLRKKVPLKELYQADNLHLSALGNQELIALLAKYIKKG